MPTREQMLSMRRCFRPRVPELKEQCVSCPFRKGNDKEFGAVVAKLAKATYVKTKKNSVRVARQRIKTETNCNGDFICHCTAYHDNMTPKSESEFRQCPGATAWYREMKGIKVV